MLIALDFDDTYTRDPWFWDKTIELAKMRGHQVIVATMRHDYEGKEVTDALEGKVDDILFTGRKAKYKFVAERGYMPSVWIDDNPFFILMDAKG